MPTKPVVRRQKAADVLRSAIETHREMTTASLAELLSPLLQEGEELIDLDAFQTLLSRLLTRHEEALVDADEAHEAQLKEDSEPRRRRDRIARRLGQRLRQCRQAAVGTFGAEETRDFLKLEGRIQDRDPEALLRQVRLTLGNLQDGSQEPPPGVVATSIFDRQIWADTLEPLAQKLQTAINDVAREVSEDEETRAARNEALRQMNAILVTISRLMKYLYRLGGNSDFESEVVPIIRRRTRRTSPTETEGSPPAGEGENDEAPRQPNPPEISRALNTG